LAGVGESDVAPRAKKIHPDKLVEVLGVLGYKYGEVTRLDITPTDVYVMRADGTTDMLIVTTGKDAEHNEGDTSMLGWAPPKKK
jgi:hypothetical protein